MANQLLHPSFLKEMTRSKWAKCSQLFIVIIDQKGAPNNVVCLCVICNIIQH